MTNGQVNGTATNGFGPEVSLKWDPKTLEIKTISVEKTLQSLVMQVSRVASSSERQFGVVWLVSKA